MPFNAAIYSQRERDALAHAYNDLRVRPAKAVVAMAAAGTLELDGERLAPFKTRPGTVIDFARKARQRRAGELKTALEAEAPRDAVEAIRVRMLRILDAELLVEERRKRGTRDLERIRGLVRAARELAALPGPETPRPTKPGDRDRATGERESARTTGGLGAEILRAAKREARAGKGQLTAAQDVTQSSGRTHGQGEASSADDASSNGQDDDRAGGPGSWAAVEGERVLSPSSAGS